ncbi:hypothetical protein DPX16_5609 [Anabarilius grahami]|uniref:Uncharacterized protein n=1 Tax=Anabarilius grahami TaxID=495550 RepID=A0A3N0YA03_ANAGA|nr:hypothetical protein DPX16_5609 [Anabarilius grahami]
MVEREGGFGEGRGRHRAGEGHGIGRACHSGDKGGRSQGGALTDLLGGALGQTDVDLCGIEERGDTGESEDRGGTGEKEEPSGDKEVELKSKNQDNERPSWS